MRCRAETNSGSRCRRDGGEVGWCFQHAPRVGSQRVPMFVSPVSDVDVARGEGLDVGWFLEQFCRSTKDTIAAHAGEPLRLRDWQHALLGRLFARRDDGRLKHRTALIGLPRKNGKSAIGSGIALYGLFAGADGSEVYSCAADRDQARIVFGVAKRMVELSPELSARAKLYRDAIELPGHASVYRVLSSEAFTKEGLSPTLVVFDELHALPRRELWDVMNLGSGARKDPLVMAITTAGVKSDVTGGDSVCYQLFQHGQKVACGEVDDPSFYFEWWAAPDSADHRSSDVWESANPAFGDLLDPEDFESAVKRTPEPEFRTKRLNQFVASITAWLPHGAFEACATDREPPGSDEPVVLGFDGSWTNDSTGIVGATRDGHVFVVDAWERVDSDDPEWRVPHDQVEQALVDACSRFNVRQVVADMWMWKDVLGRLEERGLPVLEFPQSPQRMVPACETFQDAVLAGKLTHDGDPRLVRHVGNAVVKWDGKGPRIVKDAKNSPRKIDLAVCAVMAYQQATTLVDEPVLTPLVGAW